MAGIEPAAVRQPRVRDRNSAEGKRIPYLPEILAPYAQRSESLEVLIPVLYLKGISTGDFEERWRPSSAGGVDRGAVSRAGRGCHPERSRPTISRRGIERNRK